jgi:hypothetical protein
LLPRRPPNILARMSSIPNTTPARPQARNPFDGLKPDVGIALSLGALALVWAVADGLPGGRWLPVHLFTLGVLTPLIVAFSQHQAATLLRTERRSLTWVRVAIVVGAAGVAGGMLDTSAAWSPGVIASGATVTTGAVGVAWWWLRQHRRGADSDARFTWMVASYERAHLLFLAGALFGALLGTRAVPGATYVAFRFGHLHAMVVGFATVTLLATVTLFGPMLLRAQFEPGAEATSRRWVGRVTVAITIAVVGLLGVAAPSPWSEVARVVAATALLAAAAGAAAVLRPLVRTIRRKGRRSPLAGVLLTCAIGWLALALLADAAIVATASWRYLDPLGGVALVGAFAQAVIATLLHVVTMFLPRQRRLRIWQRLDGLPVWTAAIPQLLVVALAVYLAT